MATPGTGRVAFITGGSAGVGAATAKALAALGFRVVINYSNDSSRADATIKDLQRIAADGHESHQTQSPRFVAIKADVSTPDGTTTLVERTISAMGRLDALISNHGWTRMTNLRNLDENMNMSDWEKCMNMNVTSHLRLAHAARKHLEQSEGVVVVTSSTAGIRVSGSSLAYAVTKAAQIHLVKCLADIMAPKVRVNCVIPGMIMTDWSSSFPPEKVNAAISRTKLGRLAITEDVARQICTFVNSPSITGANVIVDAGFSV